MSTDGFENCIRDHAGMGKIDPEDAENLLNKIKVDAKSMGPGAAQMKALTEKEISAKIGRLQDLLQNKAWDNIVKDLLQYRRPDGKTDLFSAGASLFEDFGYAGYPSARFIGEALIGHYNGKLADLLEHFGRKTLYSDGSMIGGRKNKADLDDLQSAMFGNKAQNPVTQALSDSVMQVMEELRQHFNEYAGGTIGKLENWGGPQSHDPTAVGRAGGVKNNPALAKANWSKFIDERLDWSKMRDPATGELFGKPPAADSRNAILGHAWDTIVTEGASNITPGGARQGSSTVAASRSDPRFFVFKDAESKRDYNREFGSGDVFNQIMDHIHGMSRDIALMQRFGPNPTATIEKIKSLYDFEAARHRTGKPSQLGRFTNRDTIMARADREKKMLDAYYEQYRGAGEAKGWLALSGTILRNNAMGALLGSSAIAHATSNWYIQTMARYLGGIPMAQTVPQLLTSFQKATKAEILRAGLDIENGAFHLGQGARQLGALQKAANWSRWLPDRTTHWGGLIPIVDANKAAFHRGTMSVMADLHGTAWAGIPQRIREKLNGYGLRENDWKIIQLADLYEPDVGSAKWLRPTEIDKVWQDHPEEVLKLGGRADLAQFAPGAGGSTLTPEAMESARKIARDVMLKFRGYMNGEREVAVPQSSMYGKALIEGGVDPNTWRGQLWKSAGMFRGFIGSMMLTQFQGMQHELSRSKSSGAAYIGAFAIGMSIMGLATLQMKQLSAGKDLLPMDPRTPMGRATWAHAILTSGSMGIFGDFIASDATSFGRGPLETLAGPGVTIPLDIAQGTLDLVRTKMTGANKKPWRGIISDTLQRTLKSNTPTLSTLWWARAAYQRIVLDQLQFLMDPDAHRKQRQAEERLDKETGQHMWWKPGHMLPSRFPHFAGSD